VTDIPNKEKASEFSSAGKSIGNLIKFLFFIDDVMFSEKSKKYSQAFEN
jgi:hypothetical protein